ncbi:MAG: hypothetical protein KY476_13870, partial [Planctomycetes bacterium]|nr:hypothetical protein [Planctomycetota bacterium]
GLPSHCPGGRAVLMRRPCVNPRQAGVDSLSVPITANIPAEGPPPGWYAVSLSLWYGRHDRYAWLRGREPTARIGYSTHTIRIGAAERSTSP